MVELREAVPRDSERLWEIRRRAVRAVESGYYTSRQRAAWSRRGDMPDFPFDDPSQYVIVAAEGDAIVGFGGAGIEEGEVKSLYADPDATSSVGTPLFRRMESVLAAEDHDRITVDASLNAVPFYHRFGYARDDLVVHENHGVDLEFVRMSKELDS